MAAATKSKPKQQAMQVSVVVRVRPLLPHEKHQVPVVRVTRPIKKRNQPSLVTLSPRDGSAEQPVEFAFEKCYDAETPQRVLFQQEIAQSIAGVLAGVNTTVFAYGATGAGKTFTMEGSKKNLGMIPRCVKQLFQVVEESKCEFQVDLSYLEIYNDRIRDLLVAKAQKLDLPIRQQVDGGISVHGLTKKRITTLREFEELYETGSGSRKKARTDLNAESSRSHSILMLHVTATDEASGEVRNGKLHLIDLAGCEDNRKTGNSGVRLAESGKINMSLFVLGKVISALNSGDIQRIPFRDSKLTRLLQDSLGGSSHAVMICNVSPVASMYQETLQTLTYAFKARGIVNDVAINRTPNPATHEAPATAKPTGIATATTSSESGRRASLLPNPSVSVMLKFTPEVASRPLKVPAASASCQSVCASLPMESRLAAWRESKNSGSRATSSSSVDVRGVRSKSTTGLKRKATTSIGEPKLTPTPSIPSEQQHQSAPASSWSKAIVDHTSKPVASPYSTTTSASATVTTVASAIPEPKKSRLSVAPSASLTPALRKVRTPVVNVKSAPSSANKELPEKAQICTGSPASDKENQPALAANTIRYAAVFAFMYHDCYHERLNVSLKPLLLCVVLSCSSVKRSRCSSPRSSSDWRSTSRGRSASAAPSASSSVRTTCSQRKT